MFKIACDFFKMCNARIEEDKEATWTGYTAPINMCTYLIMSRREHIHKKACFFCVHYINAFVDFCTYYGV